MKKRSFMSLAVILTAVIGISGCGVTVIPTGLIPNANGTSSGEERGISAEKELTTRELAMEVVDNIANVKQFSGKNKSTMVVGNTEQEIITTSNYYVDIENGNINIQGKTETTGGDSTLEYEMIMYDRSKLYSNYGDGQWYVTELEEDVSSEKISEVINGYSNEPRIELFKLIRDGSIESSINPQLINENGQQVYRIYAKLEFYNLYKFFIDTRYMSETMSDTGKMEYEKLGIDDTCELVIDIYADNRLPARFSYDATELIKKIQPLFDTEQSEEITGYKQEVLINDYDHQKDIDLPKV